MDAERMQNGPPNRPLQLTAGGGRPQLNAGVGLTYSFAMVLSKTI